MHLRSGVVWLALGLAGLSACDAVYANRTGEFNAGPVDPVNFPPEALGAGGDPLKAGTGKFIASRTYVDGTAANQFYFSFTAAQLKAGGKTLEDGVTQVVPVPAGTPRAYVFDPGAAADNCVAPEGYVFDPVRDDLHYDEQGDIFTSLPYFDYLTAAKTPLYSQTGEIGWKYAPVVAQVPVTSNGEGCQDIKSERTLVQSDKVTVPLLELQAGQKYPLGQTDGTFLARAIIDPAAGVYDFTGKAPSTGLGLQEWGWYGQFMLAYIDGGTIPTHTDATGTWLVTQRVYYPRTLLSSTGTVVNGALGKSYDVVQFKRGDARYSPICEVWTYDTTDATTGKPLAQSALPKSAGVIEDTYRASLQPVTVKNRQPSPAGDRYVYCMQLE